MASKVNVYTVGHLKWQPNLTSNTYYIMEIDAAYLSGYTPVAAAIPHKLGDSISGEQAGSSNHFVLISWFRDTQMCADQCTEIA